MRQVGVLCAAALVAIQENIVKLKGDHEKTKILAGKASSLATIFSVLRFGFFHCKLMDTAFPLFFFLFSLLLLLL